MYLKPTPVEISGVKKALRYVLLFLQISGIYFHYGNKTSIILFLNTCLSIVYFTVGIISCLGWLQYQDEEWFSSMYHLVLEKGQAVTIYSCFIASILTCLYYKKDLHGLISYIKNIDESLFFIGLPFKYKIIYKIGIGLPCDLPTVNRGLPYSTKWIHSVILFRIGSIIFVYVLDMFILMTPNNWLTYMDNMTTYHPMFSTTSVQILSSSLLSFLSDHIKFLELNIIKIGKTRKGKIEKIHMIGSCYAHCIQMSHTINDIFSIHILLSVITVFYMNVVNIYNSVLIKSRDAHNATALLFILFLCIMLRVIELWNITQPYVEFIDSAESFHITMYKMALEDNSNCLINDEIYRNHINVHPDLTYTACGFFDVDYTLVHSMIGALATFFVILLQLDVDTIQ